MNSDDTHPAVRRAQTSLLRAFSLERRFGMLEEMTANTTRWSRDAIRRRMPTASEQEVLLRWIEVVYGPELSRKVAPLAHRLGIGG